MEHDLLLNEEANVDDATTCCDKVRKLNLIRQKIMLRCLPIRLLISLSLDIYSTASYMIKKDQNPNGTFIARVSLVTCVLHAVITFACLFIYCKAKRNSDDLDELGKNLRKTVSYGAFLTNSLASLPQLWISAYVFIEVAQSSTVLKIINYVKLFCSWISSSIVLFEVDELVLTDGQDGTENPALSERVMLYSYKSILLFARMLVFVYMSVYVGWWTVSLMVVHLIFVCCCEQRFSANIFIKPLVYLVSIFWWISIDNLCHEGGILLLYMVENVWSFIFSMLREKEEDSIFLFPHFEDLYISFNGVAFYIFLAYAIKQKCCQNQRVTSDEEA